MTGAPQLAASQKRPWRPWILVVQTAAAEPHEASAALKLWTVLWTGKVWEHGIMPFCGSREESNPIYCWERWTNLRVHIKLVEDAEGRTRSANWGRFRPGSFAYPALDKLWLELGHRASWGSLHVFAICTSTKSKSTALSINFEGTTGKITFCAASPPEIWITI